MSTSISQNDLGYPERLLKIKNPPKELYYKGNIIDGSIFNHCLSMVGSRNISSYGKEVVKKLVPAFVSLGITIVSGFMYGVDALCHEVCVKSGGRTIAIMPCGIDYIYPENQKDLYYQILESGGLVLSEYEGSCKPQIWMYPQRNRIVAGLSQATLVVEAGIDSGSLITASHAKSYGRKVFAIPGNIFSTNAQGIYHLLEEGAKMVTSSFDVLDFYQFKSAGQGSNSLFNSNMDGVRKDIYKVLSREPLCLDELVREINLDFSLVSSEITLMELEGILFKEDDRYYVV